MQANLNQSNLFKSKEADPNQIRKGNNTYTMSNQDNNNASVNAPVKNKNKNKNNSTTMQGTNLVNTITQESQPFICTHRISTLSIEKCQRLFTWLVNMKLPEVNIPAAWLNDVSNVCPIENDDTIGDLRNFFSKT